MFLLVFNLFYLIRVWSKKNNKKNTEMVMTKYRKYLDEYLKAYMDVKY